VLRALPACPIEQPPQPPFVQGVASSDHRDLKRG
jgi:hypothetical protein